MSESPRWNRVHRWILAGLLVSGSGCGYTNGSLIPDQHRTVYLPIFQNETFYRDLEVGLTRQVQEELGSRPGIFIVPRDQADIVLRGTIINFQERVLSETTRDQIRESSAVTTVRVDLVDPRNARVLKSYQVSDVAEYYPGRGETLNSAEEESFFDLARKIVAGLEEGFPRGSKPSKATKEYPSDA